MKNKQNMAVAIALAVVVVMFGTRQWNNDLARVLPATLPLITGELAPESHDAPDAPVEKEVVSPTLADEAWGNFQRYLAYARAHNLEGVKSLSYRTSAACTDPNQLEECYRLMDSVVFFGSEFKRENFTNIKSSAGEVILYTDYIDGLKTLLSFRRDAGVLKVAGIRLCAQGEDLVPECLDD